MTDTKLPQYRNRKSRAVFTQWEKSSMTSFRKLIKRSGRAAEMLVILVQNMNDSNAVVMSQKVLAELMGCSARSIRDYVRILVDENWINVLKIGTSNVYHVNRTCFWQKARNGRHYTTLTASVVIGESEQKQNIEKLTEPHAVKRLPRQDEVSGLLIQDDEEPPSQEEMDLPTTVQDENGATWDIDPQTGEMQRRIDD